MCILQIVYNLIKFREFSSIFFSFQLPHKLDKLIQIQLVINVTINLVEFDSYLTIICKTYKYFFSNRV